MGFRKKALRDQEGAIRRYADLLIERLSQISKKPDERVDIVSWYNVRRLVMPPFSSQHPV